MKKLLIASILVLTAQLFLFWNMNSEVLSKNKFTYKEAPLLTTPDGYFYLDLADKYKNTRLQESQDLSPKDIPLLSKSAALISFHSDISLEKVAFYLPALFTMLMLPVFLYYGFSVQNKWVGLIGYSLFSLAPTWLHRTGLGNFDTDAINQVLIWNILLFGILFVSRSCEKNFFYAGGLLISCFLLLLWWPQAGASFALLAAAATLTSAFWVFNFHRHLLSYLLLTVSAAFFIVILNYSSFLPEFISSFFESIKAHIKLALGSQESEFISVGKSISELSNNSFLDSLNDVTGFWLITLISSIGFMGLIQKDKANIATVVMGVLFFVFSLLLGNRFLMYAAPAFALGVAWFLCETLPSFFRTRRRGATVATLIGISSLVYLYSSALDINNKPTNDANAAQLMTAYKHRSQKNASTWNWWGPGYFIRYFSKRDTFIDGGSQTNEKTFLASVPYASQNPILSSNWIKFFSKNPDGLKTVQKQLGLSTQDSIDLLENIFKAPANWRKHFPSNLSNKKISWWKQYLFPKTDVHLVALHDMLYHGTWLQIAERNLKKKSEFENTTYAFSTAKILRDKGIIITPSGQIRYSKLYFVTPKELSHDPVREDGPVAILIKGAPYVLIIPQEYFNAVAFQLLFVSPDSIPGFTPVAYHPFVGGVWKVE